MIFKLTAAAALVSFSPADEPAMYAGMGVDESDSITIVMDTDGEVIDVDGAEFCDDRTISQVCTLVSEYFEARRLADRCELLTTLSHDGRTAYHAIPFERMVAYLDARNGRNA